MKSLKKRTKKTGRGFINQMVDRLPFEMHIPGYNYCGPGTKLSKRLAKGEAGINKLDEECKMHDILYSRTSDAKERGIADKKLQMNAMQRVLAKDATFGERAAGTVVAAAMRAKRTLGGNLQHKILKNRKRNKSIKFSHILKNVKGVVKKRRDESIKNVTAAALSAAKLIIKEHRGEKPSIKDIPRTIPMPKIGGALPLVPIFAGLSALGALLGGTSAVTNAITTTKNAQKSLKEEQKHNRTMEAIAVGRSRDGNGLFLKPYKNGLGLYMQKENKQKN